jgi:hypothetical protein
MGMAFSIVVATSKEERGDVQARVHSLGVVSDNWDDGSFNFDCYDEECLEEAITVLDNMNILNSLL